MLDRHPEMLLKVNPDFERNRVRKAFRSWIYCIKKFKAQTFLLSELTDERFLKAPRALDKAASPQPIVMQPQLFSFLVFDISLPSQSSKCSETLVLQRQTLLSWITLNGRSADLDSLERVFDRERLMSFPNPHTHIFCIFCSGTTVILIKK